MTAETRKGDFESLYSEHLASVHRFVLQFVRDPGVADELAQDTFLKAFQAEPTYRGDGPQRVWLMRIARNLSLDYLRSPRARTAALPSLETVEAKGTEPERYAFTIAGREEPLSVEEQARQSEMAECVEEFVGNLPETLRTPLILHDVEELTSGQIAEVLGVSLEAAKMRLHRARGKLRDMMEERCELFRDERDVLSCLPAPRLASARSELVSS
jgi:RNA polymerase sigma-70 factor, ECF subfamily